MLPIQSETVPRRTRATDHRLAISTPDWKTTLRRRPVDSPVQRFHIHRRIEWPLLSNYIR